MFDKSGLQVRMDWLPSVANRYADALSRRFPRPADSQAAVAFRSGWDAGAFGRVSLPPVRRAPIVSPSAKMGRAREGLGQGQGETPVATGGFHHAHGREVAQESSSGHADDPEVASAAMVLTGLGHGVASDGAGSTTGRSMGRAAQPEPAMARSVAEGELKELTSGRMMEARGRSSAMSRSTQLVTDHGCSARTSQTLESLWRTWLMFCAVDGREPLPFQEAHMVAFV